MRPQRPSGPNSVTRRSGCWRFRHRRRAQFGLGPFQPSHGGAGVPGSHGQGKAARCRPGGRFRCSVPVRRDGIDWERGSYALVERNGRVDATGGLKLASRMVEEGAVLVSPSMPGGRCAMLLRRVVPIRSTVPVSQLPCRSATRLHGRPSWLRRQVSRWPCRKPPTGSLRPRSSSKPVEPVPEAPPPAPEPPRRPIAALPPFLALKRARASETRPEPAPPADPWGWESQDRAEEEPPRDDDAEPKGGQS